jgi:hypothetical protein
MAAKLFTTDKSHTQRFLGSESLLLSKGVLANNTVHE